MSLVAARGAKAPETDAEAGRLSATLAKACRDAGADNAGFRKAAAGALGEYIGARREEARARLESGGRGSACAQYISRVEDIAIRALHEALVAKL